MRINNSNNNINFTSKPLNARDVKNIGKAIRENTAFLYDVDTTYGFMSQKIVKRADGIRDGLPVPGADVIVEALARIKKMAKGKLAKFETVDAHKPNDPELKYFVGEPFNSDIHSEKGTLGFEKIPETVFGKPDVVIEVEPEKQDVPTVSKIRNILKSKGIIKLEKNENSPVLWGNGETGLVEDNVKGLKFFDNMKKAGAKIALVYGVATDYCVKDAVATLKKFGIRPIVIEDAIKEIAEPSTQIADHSVFGDVTVMTTAQLGKILGKVK